MNQEYDKQLKIVKKDLGLICCWVWEILKVIFEGVFLFYFGFQLIPRLIKGFKSYEDSIIIRTIFVCIVSIATLILSFEFLGWINILFLLLTNAISYYLCVLKRTEENEKIKNDIPETE